MYVYTYLVLQIIVNTLWSCLCSIHIVCPCRDASARKAASLLYAMSQLVNQAVGDAVSDMLMVEAILIHKKVYTPSLLAIKHLKLNSFPTPSGAVETG